jgi:hypothetical protein
MNRVGQKEFLLFLFLYLCLLPYLDFEELTLYLMATLKVILILLGELQA